MKISVSWIAVILILVILLFFLVKAIDELKTLEIYEESQKVREGFQGSFSDLDTELNINTCPAETKSYVDTGGRTVCCEGELLGGKCEGKRVCSLSEGIVGLPTCSQWLDAYLENKGRDRCPPTMPHYYENRQTNIAGCTAGKRNRDGTEALPNTKFCNLYQSKDDDLIKEDSCTNQKIFDTTTCFSRPVKGTNKRFLSWGKIPPPIYCSALDEGSISPISCIDDSTFIRTIDYWVDKYSMTGFKNWKEQSISWGAYWKLNFCSVVQKVGIDKTMKLADLESYKVF